MITIEQEQFCALPRTEFVKCWTRQTTSDAGESTNWEGLCGTPWQMVAGPPLPRIVVARTPEVEPRRFYVSSADIEAHAHTGGCPGCAALASRGRVTNHIMTNPENESERSLREP